MYRPLLAVAVAALLFAAGCTATPAGSDGPVTTADITTTTTEDPGYGTQFVYVSRLDNQSRYREFAPERRAHFRNLSPARQAAFERALERGRIEYGPDENNPFDFNDGDRPAVVKYEGDWYYVRVAIV